MTSPEVREKLVEALQLDLVGPTNDHAFANELLPALPTRWYLTGFLVPSKAPIEQREDETSNEEITSGEDTAGSDDALSPDRDPARKGYLPSSMGLSVLVAPGTCQLEARVSWGDYAFEGTGDRTDEPEPVVDEDAGEAAEGGPRRGWRRIPREAAVEIPLTDTARKPIELAIPESGGLALTITLRQVSVGAAMSDRMPAGTESVSVFLVNRRKPNEEQAYRSFAFQAGLELRSETPFVARPDLRYASEDCPRDDWDEEVADLQYRDVCEYAVGHAVSATAVVSDDGLCRAVRTTWVPRAEVEFTAPATVKGVELKMAALGRLEDSAAAATALMPMVEQYRAWIEVQRGKIERLEQRRLQTGKDMLIEADHAAKRIESGIVALADGQVLEAFRVANRAMERAARQRISVLRGVEPGAVDEPAWRPFQLAFILMTLDGIVDPLHGDRERVDLIFFPTGGGKTEAYLGLAAFTMVLRRLRVPGIRSAGLTVLMRYTLRLLTLDQLSRAAALVCALELERKGSEERLGQWPFEIGLWVGTAATPNRMGHQGYTGPGKDDTAYIKTTHFNENDRRYPAPIPLENCPWCGTKFEGSGRSFRLVPNVQRPLDLRITCVNHRCEFRGGRPLPIVAVDEPIYRRLPSFLIATVDKFAALPWTGRTGALFGLVERYDNDGFYGPCDPGRGRALGGYLPPPELVVQDELHLISGPLGTIAGVYETAIDALASWKQGDVVVRPKVIASTATVRRASTQIRALFGRYDVTVFPPPGPDRRDSFFALTRHPNHTPARLYVGLAAQGRSLKVVMLRAYLALLSAGQKLYEQEGGSGNHDNPADPYMTLLGYFNSLRELGGSRRIVEDEVTTRLSQYARRRRVEPSDAMFADRKLKEPHELTSRVPTNKVASTKRRLALAVYKSERIDVALATNMISVGLDITRLGLMVVLGQPKTSAEYIQATSRVGRDPDRSGLVVTLLNLHKPRDRSHYERFGMYHATFYRAVEPTSVTPFSPRALDRALAAALVGLCRHGDGQMTPPRGVEQVMTLRTKLEDSALAFAERAANHRQLTDSQSRELRDVVLQRGRQLLDAWVRVAQMYQSTHSPFQYQRYEERIPARLLYDILDPELDRASPEQRFFRANRSMRDVEPQVDVFVQKLQDWEDR